MFFQSSNFPFSCLHCLFPCSEMINQSTDIPSPNSDDCRLLFCYESCLHRSHAILEHWIDTWDSRILFWEPSAWITWAAFVFFIGIFHCIFHSSSSDDFETSRVRGHPQGHFTSGSSFNFNANSVFSKFLFVEGLVFGIVCLRFSFWLPFCSYRSTCIHGSQFL